VNGVDLASVPWPPADLARYDVILVLAAHAGYDWKAIARDARLILDTRNATDGCDGAGTIIRL
jgi:UDP-N-acetyl-D-mannosaminuronate dehydrogenase